MWGETNIDAKEKGKRKGRKADEFPGQKPVKASPRP